MSLWTPDGERPIQRERSPEPTTTPSGGDLDDFDLESLSPEEQARAQVEQAEAAKAGGTQPEAAPDLTHHHVGERSLRSNADADFARRAASGPLQRYRGSLTGR